MRCEEIPFAKPDINFLYFIVILSGLFPKCWLRVQRIFDVWRVGKGAGALPIITKGFHFNFRDNKLLSEKFCNLGTIEIQNQFVNGQKGMIWDYGNYDKPMKIFKLSKC